MAEGFVPQSVRFPPHQLAAVRWLAEQDGMPWAEWIRARVQVAIDQRTAGLLGPPDLASKVRKATTAFAPFAAFLRSNAQGTAWEEQVCDALAALILVAAELEGAAVAST